MHCTAELVFQGLRDMADPQDISTAKRSRIGMLLPWETGFAGMILQRRVTSPLSLATAALSPVWDSSFIREAVKNLDPLPKHKEVKTASISAKTTGRPAFTKVGLKATPLHWATKVDDERNTALARWHLLVSENPLGSKLGTELLEIGSAEDSSARVQSLVDDTFAGKATRTLEQRSGSLLMFYRWRRTLPLYVGMFPFSETDHPVQRWHLTRIFQL